MRKEEIWVGGECPIELDDLAVRLGRREVLRGIHLAVPAGAIFALVGPNGAGKTTLLKTLVNLHRPSRGVARVLGRPSTELQGDALQPIGYVSENQKLPGWMKLRAFLDYLRPFYPTWDRELELSLVTQFRLPADQKLGSMSRGQQMKASLLAALAYHPRLLLLDEPFSGLDPLARDEFIAGVLDRAAAEEARHMTVLLSSHDLGEIESFATHLGYLEAGRIVFSEDTEKLLKRFREVTVVLPAGGTATLPARATPANWLQPEMSGAVCRFVHTEAADESQTRQEVSTAFPSAERVDLVPMSLRQIFVAIARGEQTGSARVAIGGQR